MADLPMVPVVERNVVYGARDDVVLDARADGRIWLRAVRRRR
ncbi:MAG TPA: hypothetical protein VFM29_02810 [Vicinamibacteria bacterium]|nr:hypothetical protein [Vicinamibacteria bacterium]